MVFYGILVKLLDKWRQVWYNEIMANLNSGKNTEVLSTPLSDQELDKILASDTDINKVVQKIMQRKAQKDVEALVSSAPALKLTDNEFSSLKDYFNTKENLPDLHETFKLFITSLSADDKVSVAKQIPLIVKILKQNLGL